MKALELRTAPAETGTQLDLIVATNGHTGDLTGVLGKVATAELHDIPQASRDQPDGEEILAVARVNTANRYDRYLVATAVCLDNQARLAQRHQDGTRLKERKLGKNVRFIIQMRKNQAALQRQRRRRETEQLLASLYELYTVGKPRVRKLTGAPAYLSMRQAVWRRFFKQELAKQLQGQTPDLHAAVNDRFRTLAQGMSPREMRRKLLGREMVPVKRRRLWQDEARSQKRKTFVRLDAPTSGHDDSAAQHEVGMIDSQEDYTHAIGRCVGTPRCRYITADGSEWVVRMRRRSVVSKRWIHWIQEQKRVRSATAQKPRKPIRVHSHTGNVPACLAGEIRQLMLAPEFVRTGSSDWFAGPKAAMPKLQASQLGLIPAVAADYLADATPLGAEAQELVRGLGGTVRCYNDNPFIVAAPFAGYDADAIVREDQVSHTGAFALEAFAIASHLTADLLRLAEVSLRDVLGAPELAAIWQSLDTWVYELYALAHERPETGIREAAVQFLTRLVEGLDLIALWDQDEGKLSRLLDRAEVEPSLAGRREQFYHELLESDALAANWNTSREKVYRLLEIVEQIGNPAAFQKALQFALRVVKPTKITPTDFLARNLTPAQGAQIANVYPTMAFSAAVLGTTAKARKGEGKALSEEFVAKAEAYAKALLTSPTLPLLVELDQEAVMSFLRVLATYGGDLREGAMGFHSAYVAKQASA